MSIDAHAHDTLRRTRSTGDLPQRPEPVHRHPGSRYSDSQSDVCDPPAGQQLRTLASSSGPHAPQSISSGRWSPPAVIDLHPENAQTQASPVTRATLEPRHLPLQPSRNGSLYVRMLAFFGMGRGASRTRRSLVGLYFNLTSGFLQIIIIATILALSGTRFKSPTHPALTEWVACNRPLGVWACIWIARALLACLLTFWNFMRERLSRRRHAEDGRANGISNGSALGTPSPPLTGDVPTNGTTQQSIDHQGTLVEVPEQPPLPYTRLYSRFVCHYTNHILTLLSSLLTLSWFLTAHILEYTSINTCRYSSPHIWWLTFGILCLMYLMVLEVFILGFVVFIIAPVLFLFWNIFLVCIGRHPLQNPSVIKPEIGKLSKSLVDRIPLVIYIPPPPAGSPHEKLAIPEPALSYPPKPAAAPSPKTRFRFIRNLSSFKVKKGDNTMAGKEFEGGNGEPLTWEQHWEQGEYPFVILEGNRAACAICLMDFEEPKKIGANNSNALSPNAGSASTPAEASHSGTSSGNINTTAISPATLINEEEREDNLKLADAGDGVQPLRLLACGHVFHKTCLDPWLTDVSGRCPVCQRAVEFPELKKTRKERR